MGEVTGEVVWVEVLSRHRDVAARHRCAGPEIRIGRAYDNDVVIDDPYVAPHHVRIVRDGVGDLVAEDLGSVNGLSTDRDPTRRRRILIDGDHAIRIGTTALRVRSARHAVAPERVKEADRHHWIALAVLAIAVLAADGLSQWLNEITEPKLSRYVVPLLALPIITLAWSAAWSILSRIFAGLAHFERNLLIALSGVLAYWIYENAIEVLGFALAWRMLATYQSAGLWALLGIVVFLHLRCIGPRHLMLKGAISAMLVVIAIAIQLVSLTDRVGGVEEPTLMRNFMPPGFRMTALRDEAAFFGDVERLKRKLDHDRSDEPPAGHPDEND